MVYLAPTDSIEAAGLSVRSHNALRRVGMHTIADLRVFEHEKLGEIQNLGAKSLAEVSAFLESVLLGTDGLTQYDSIMKRVHIDYDTWSEESNNNGY